MFEGATVEKVKPAKKAAPANIQIRIRMKGAAIKRLRPTAATMRQLINVWIETGKLPPEVKIEATVWDKEKLTQTQVRAKLRGMKLYFGCPGLVEAYARPDTTMCDYDEPKPLALICETQWKLAREFGIRPLWIRQDRTTRGWHVTTRWNRKFSPAEIVALQCLMGSDPVRERFNLLRVFSGQAESNKRWNLLFAHKLK